MREKCCRLAAWTMCSYASSDCRHRLMTSLASTSHNVHDCTVLVMHACSSEQTRKAGLNQCPCFRCLHPYGGVYLAFAFSPHCMITAGNPW